MNDGVLSLVVPKKPEAQPRQIPLPSPSSVRSLPAFAGRRTSRGGFGNPFRVPCQSHDSAYLAQNSGFAIDRLGEGA